MHTAYLFDFDGTLVDSMPTWSAKMLHILQRNGVEYPPDIIKQIAPLGDKGTALYFRDRLGVALSVEEMIAQMDEFALPRYRDEIAIKPGVESFLKKAKANGISLNVLTASPHKMLDPCLKRLGIWELFDKVWSTDDLELTKSQPEIYVEAAKRMGVMLQDVVFFDDNANAVHTAKMAGVYTVGVYDDSGAEFEKQIRQDADRYLFSFKEAELM